MVARAVYDLGEKALRGEKARRGNNVWEASRGFCHASPIVTLESRH